MYQGARKAEENTEHLVGSASIKFMEIQGKMPVKSFQCHDNLHKQNGLHLNSKADTYQKKKRNLQI